MNGKGGLNKLKRIGILGGMSYESTIKYYDLILQKYYERYHDYNYPEILIFSLNFQRIIDYELGDDKDIYVNYLMSGVNSLKRGGVDFIIMSANSPHAVYKELESSTDIYILSIVNATAMRAKVLKIQKLLLLGIKYTMQSSFYQDTFKDYGMNVITPLLEEQEIIDRIIFEELVLGIFKKKSKDDLINIIKNYHVDGVILGCTELPLILTQSDVDIELLDTVEIHTTAALNYCIGKVI